MVIKWGLDELPPFLFAALRFALSAFPLLLFVRRPKVAWRKLAAFGVLLGAGQFGLLFYAMRADIAPGLLVPVFGMGASSLLLAEAMPGWKLGAAALVLAGLALNGVASRPAARGALVSSS